MTARLGVVVTGTPGSGKTSVTDELARRGHAVVREAATDVIAAQQALGVAEPWRDPGFTEQVAVEQERRRAAAMPGSVFDRSPLCTLALARFLDHPVGPTLAAALARCPEDLASPVFLLRPLGFIVATDARRISYAQSLRFEELHRAAYYEYGFELTEIAVAPVAERADQIERAASLGSPQ